MGKYMKYAIGEILLVMVGILLALQVSNWNQQRIAQNKERLLLNALHEEFVENKSQLENVVSWHYKALKATRYVISLFPIDPETIDLDSLQAGMKYWGYRYTFNPSQGVIRSLVNTSSFDIVSDPELRILLVSWEDVLADYQEEEVIASLTIRNHLGPEITSNIPWHSLTDERYDKNFLASFQFENIFHSRENNLMDILGEMSDDGELVRIQTTIDRIIELSKPDKR
jgi:hypothetical protein